MRDFRTWVVDVTHTRKRFFAPDLVLEPLDRDLALDLPPLPLAVDNSTITRVTRRTRNTAATRIFFADNNNPVIFLFGNHMASPLYVTYILVTGCMTGCMHLYMVREVNLLSFFF